jgi:hypothetical protein
VLGIAVQKRPPELDHCGHTFVGEPVVNRAVLPTCGHEAAPAQASEVIGDLRLRLGKELNQLADRSLLVGYELEDPQAGAVTENSEVLGEQVGFDRRVGEAEGGVADGGCHGSRSYAKVLMSGNTE